MNASIAIQVLPKVVTNEETVRIVDEVIAYIKSFGLHMEVGPFETTSLLTMELKTAKHREVTEK